MKLFGVFFFVVVLIVVAFVLWLFMLAPKRNERNARDAEIDSILE